MAYPIISSGRLGAVLFCLAVFVCSFALAQETKQEQALFFTVDDPALDWGPCPEFLPDGCEIAILNGDPSRENADIFFKVPGNSVIPRHWHTSAERMILISGELHLEYDGQETAILKPGGYAYGPAKLPHQGFCAEGDPCVLFIAFELPIDAMPVERQKNAVQPPR